MSLLYFRDIVSFGHCCGSQHHSCVWVLLDSIFFFSILHSTFQLYQSLSLWGGLEVKSSSNLLPSMSEMHHVFCNKNLFPTFGGHPLWAAITYNVLRVSWTLLINNLKGFLEPSTEIFVSFVLFVWVVFFWISVCAPCACSACGILKRALDHLRTEILEGC